MSDQLTVRVPWPDWRSWPGWVQALAVYAVARLVGFLVLERVARFQVANPWTDARPGYFPFAGIWDGDWYRRIAEHGYPLPLPRGADGLPVQSEWAFYPGYPMLVRGVQELTGASWTVAAPLVSLLLGAGAVVVIHRLFARLAGSWPAMTGVALVSFFPTAVVLQVAYTEALALLALAGSLYLLVTRRYLWAIPVVAVLGLSRAVALPLAVVVAVHLLVRWRHRATDPFGPAERLKVLLLGAFSVAAGLAWPLFVGLSTGSIGAYTEVQGAWRGGSTVFLRPWWSMAQYVAGPWVGPAVLVTLVVATTWWILRRGRVAGPELQAWCLAYLAYLLVVVDPFTSLFRFLLLLFPVALMVAVGVRSRAHLLTWVFAFVSLQVIWVAWLWRFTPPSDFPP